MRAVLDCKTNIVIDEGLQKNATTMSQIPTYVTAVPNGTEKVGDVILRERIYADSI